MLDENLEFGDLSKSSRSFYLPTPRHNLSLKSSSLPKRSLTADIIAYMMDKPGGSLSSLEVERGEDVSLYTITLSTRKNIHLLQNDTHIFMAFPGCYLLFFSYPSTDEQVNLLTTTQEDVVDVPKFSRFMSSAVKKSLGNLHISPEFISLFLTPSIQSKACLYAKRLPDDDQIHFLFNPFVCHKKTSNVVYFTTGVLEKVPSDSSSLFNLYTKILRRNLFLKPDCLEDETSLSSPSHCGDLNFNPWNTPNSSQLEGKYHWDTLLNTPSYMKHCVALHDDNSLTEDKGTGEEEDAFEEESTVKDQDKSDAEGGKKEEMANEGGDKDN